MGPDPQAASDLEILPPHLNHQSRLGDGGTLQTDRYGLGLNTPQQRWESWVLQLGFTRLGESRHGNGFYVNIPNTEHDVIFTAGHNLVEAPQKLCTNIRIITATGETPVTPEMIHICEQYYNQPDESSQIFDYAIILQKRDPKKPRRGFGFNLTLGLAPPLAEEKGEEEEKDVLQERNLYVSGYMPNDSPANTSPRKSDGTCVQASASQLVYKAATEEGMSGGPVWLGFRNFETVVAIHNYGKEDNNGQGNRGSRLNLKFWENVFGWLRLGWTNVSLQYRSSPTYSMHLHMNLSRKTSQNIIAGDGRVRVGRPGRIDTWFNVLPVSALPNDTNKEACYGFLLCGGTGGWVKWNAQANKVLLSARFDAKCEVKLINIVGQPGKPFEILTQLNSSEWKTVTMGMALLVESDLEWLGDDEEGFEDTSEIGFVAPGKKLFEFK